jgi:hypothetical protein
VAGVQPLPVAAQQQQQQQQEQQQGDAPPWTRPHNWV